MILLKLLITIVSFLWSTIFTFTALILGVICFSRKLPLYLMRRVWAPVYLFCTGIRYEVVGQVDLDPNKNYVFFANHRSFIDIPIINVLIKRNLYFVLKEELRWTYVIGWFAQFTEMIFVDRSNKIKSQESLKLAGETIKKGKNVIIFPEGTRSKDDQILPFKRGGFALAQQAEVEIVPIIIKGTEKAIPKGSYLFQPAKVKVKVLAPFKINADDISFTKSRIELKDLMQEALNQL